MEGGAGERDAIRTMVRNASSCRVSASAGGVTYARRLGFFSATMAVIGGIIGSGVFLGPEVVAARVGSAGFTLAAWIVGGVIAIAGALTFGELGARRPRAGGGYVYLREAFGSLPAFLYGWALLLVIATGATAAVAVTFASYAVPLLGWPATATLPLAIGAIVLLSAVNYVGVQPAAVTQNVFTILKLAALAALIAVGLFSPPSTALYRPLPSFTAPAGAWGVGVALGAALVPVLFAYGGWQQTNFIAEELVAPERDLPRALVLGVLGVVAVYLLVNVAYLRVLGVAGLAGSTAPAADVMARVVGLGGTRLISAGIAVSTFGFLNLVILVTPRVFQAMAADGVFLKRLAALHPTYRTPTGAIAFMGAWSVLLALSGTYAQLLDYVVFGDWIFFGLTGASLFIYRGRDLERGKRSEVGFRIPAYPWTPALFVLAAAYVVASSALANPRNALIGTGLLALGVPVYLAQKRVRTPLDESSGEGHI
jgi:APA family basic amino acid/polyamine antiporter